MKELTNAETTVLFFSDWLLVLWVEVFTEVGEKFASRDATKFSLLNLIGVAWLPKLSEKSGMVTSTKFWAQQMYRQHQLPRKKQGSYFRK